MDWKLLDEFKKSKKLWSTAALGCAEDAASMSQIVIELDVSRVIRSPLIRLHEQRVVILSDDQARIEEARHPPDPQLVGAIGYQQLHRA